jgi:hypothetical protein
VLVLVLVPVGGGVAVVVPIDPSVPVAKCTSRAACVFPTTFQPHEKTIDCWRQFSLRCDRFFGVVTVFRIAFWAFVAGMMHRLNWY